MSSISKMKSSCELLAERGICSFLVWLCVYKVICMLFWEHKQDLNYGLSKSLNPLYSNMNTYFPPSYADYFNARWSSYYVSSIRADQACRWWKCIMLFREGHYVFLCCCFFFFFLNTGNTDWLCCLAKRQRKINSLPVPLLLTQASGMYEDWINEHYMQHSPTAHHWFELIKTSLWESVVSLKWSQLASVN